MSSKVSPVDYFQIGETYERREEIHRLFGGQNQGGISTPRAWPVIFLFSSPRGEEFGYSDGWQDGIYYYTGEGQKGPMEFVRGNKQVRDHRKLGKDLMLFETTKGGGRRFVGQMTSIGHEIREGVPDVDGNRREAIVFHLVPEAGSSPRTSTDEDYSYGATLLEKRFSAFGAVAETEEIYGSLERKQRYYKRSGTIADYVRSRGHGFCEGCGSYAPFLKPDGVPYLESHHIERLSDGGVDQPESMAGLDPTCHAKAHYSSDRKDFNDQLRQMAKWVEKGLDGGRFKYVVAGVVVDERGRVLLTQRPAAKHLGGKWEFPGGKVEAGEKLEDALERELLEELALPVEDIKPLFMIDHEYERLCIRLMVFRALAGATGVELREHQDAEWIDLSRLITYDLAPADRRVAAKLKESPILDR